MDSTYHHALAWHRAFTRYDVDVPMWRVHRTIGMGGDKLVAEVAGEEVESEHGDDLRDAWSEEYAKVEEEVDPLPGATDLVRRLAERGLPRGARVLGREGVLRERARVARRRRPGAHAGDLRRRRGLQARPRPHRRHPRARSQPERAVFVGDTPYDVEAASRAGLGCVGVLTGGFSQAELEEAGAALVVEALDRARRRRLVVRCMKECRA